ncbi:unnamed protein product [Trichogramma brassicae]|uniref:FKRP stem domain-containing protein n=1 Tax=Trichogramma brassicae TaxID=86971 RepID=A0A6H5HSC5_9HYME|nr:unnamed protein product [Trichogramma brassicae]
MVRLKPVRILILLLLVAKCIFWYKVIFSSDTSKLSKGNNSVTEVPQKLHRRLAHLVTIVIRQFESFENDITNTVKTILNSYPTMNIIIVSNDFLYPPLELDFTNHTLKNVKLVYLQPSFGRTVKERNPVSFITTKYIAFLPDATRLITKQTLQEAIESASKLGIVSVPVGKNSLDCLNAKLRIKQWSLKVSKASGIECDMVSGKHVTIIDVDIINKLTDPFMLPYPNALYVQTTALGMKVHILKNLHFLESKQLYRSQQAQTQLQTLHRTREAEAFKKLGIKQVTHVSGNTEWYGCTRDTQNCFGPVVNDIPSYLLQNRYTPPCCLAGLRKVALHVFNKLDEVGVRYWLEAESLLGAMHNGDILPWDHKVVIGINKDDLNRSPWIVKARSKAVVDNKGFVWEKATEGEFFKVQYSKVNRLHVNILPFYSKNGTMTRDAWFLKVRDFSEHFLHPMSSIDFIGRQVPSPNNIRDFLELKFYRGVIENPELSVKRF